MWSAIAGKIAVLVALARIGCCGAQLDGVGPTVDVVPDTVHATTSGSQKVDPEKYYLGNAVKGRDVKPIPGCTVIGKYYSPLSPLPGLPYLKAISWDWCQHSCEKNLVMDPYNTMTKCASFAFYPDGSCYLQNSATKLMNDDYCKDTHNCWGFNVITGPPDCANKSSWPDPNLAMVTPDMEPVSAPSSLLNMTDERTISVSVLAVELDYAALSADAGLVGQFTKLATESFVTVLGVDAEDIKVSLASGSVMVQAAITPPARVYDAKLALMETEYLPLAQSIMQAVKSQPELTAIATNGLENFYVSEVTVENSKHYLPVPPVQDPAPEAPEVPAVPVTLPAPVMVPETTLAPKPSGPTYVGEGEECTSGVGPDYAMMCTGDLSCEVPAPQMPGKPGVCTSSTKSSGPAYVGEGEECTSGVGPDYAKMCTGDLSCEVPAPQMPGKPGVCSSSAEAPAASSMPPTLPPVLEVIPPGSETGETFDETVKSSQSGGGFQWYHWLILAGCGALGGGGYYVWSTSGGDESSEEEDEEEEGSDGPKQRLTRGSP